MNRIMNRRFPAGRDARTGRYVSAAALLLALLCAASFPADLRAQDTGELRGKVTDKETGESIVRATVSIVGTKLGGFSDLNGVYTIRRVPAGRYTVRVTYVGYNASEITEVVVGAGVNKLDVGMQSAAIKGKELVITGTAGKGTEEAILNERKKATGISDGISITQIKKSPDATSGDALGRITGISVASSKFVSVRGTSERYNNTQVNGVTMVSTEPDKKAFSFDLFPANLLENMVVTKTFTPDLPGDFSGGMVRLNTSDFPDQQTIKLTIGGSYADGTTFESLRMGPFGGTDYLGIDDGARQLPASIPDTLLRKGTFTIDSIAQMSKAFSNTWGLNTRNAPLNSNFLLSYGDRFNVADNDLGTIVALSYRSGFTHTPMIRTDEGRYDFSGSESSYSTLLGGIFNAAYKFSDLHQISVNNMYSRTGQNKFTYMEGDDGGQQKRKYGIYYQERGLYSGQVNGRHQFPDLADIRLEWRGYGSLSDRKEPDFRRISYVRDGLDTTGPFVAAIGTGAPSSYNGGRFYSNMEDELFGFGADLSIPVGDAKIKLGGTFENKGRDFRVRHFGYIANNPDWQFSPAEIDTIFAPEHIGKDGFVLIEMSEATDKYTAHGHLDAGYLMVDLPFTVSEEKFRLITGVRVEDSRTVVNTVNRNFNQPMTVDYQTTDYLPSINFVYQMNPSANIRAAFTKTLLRPEIREYAAFTFYEFTTDQLIYGNPDIRRAVISNYDLRFELFPDPGELLALSLFYKDMRDAIEAVALRGNVPERTWINADKAETVGLEVEARKSFGFIDESLLPLSFGINYTWLDSKVDISETELTPAESGRRLQGQANYVINGGIYYDDPESGTAVSLLYNRMGPRYAEIGTNEVPDFIEEPRDMLDLSVTQAFYERYEVKLAVRDILSQDIILTQGDVKARVDVKQTNASLSFSVRF